MQIAAMYSRVFQHRTVRHPVAIESDTFQISPLGEILPVPEHPELSVKFGEYMYDFVTVTHGGQSRDFDCINGQMTEESRDDLFDFYEETMLKEAADAVAETQWFGRKFKPYRPVVRE